MFGHSHLNTDDNKQYHMGTLLLFGSLFTKQNCQNTVRQTLSCKHYLNAEELQLQGMSLWWIVHALKVFSAKNDALLALGAPLPETGLPQEGGDVA